MQLWILCAVISQEFKKYDVVKKKTLHADSHRRIRDQLTGSSLL